jgi:hypothetical protein
MDARLSRRRVISGVVAAATASWAAGVMVAVGEDGPTRLAFAIAVDPARVAAGAWVPLRVTITASSRAVHNGIVTLSVPSGWPRPSRSAVSGGHVRASGGVLTVRGMKVSVRGVDLPRGSSLTITYGGGRGAATAPTIPLSYAFRLSWTSMASPAAHVERSLLIRVEAPRFGCTTSTDPTGSGAPLRLPNGIALSNLYNTRASVGVIRQCYGRSGLATDVTLKGLSPVGPGPAGYPEVAYGYDLVDRPVCQGCHTQPFPLAVSAVGLALSRVIVSYSLDVASPRSLPDDLIYDLWLERQPSPDALPRQGDIELIIFLYRHPPDSPCVPGGPLQMLSTLASFNGREGTSRWLVCRITGGTPATSIGFLMGSPSQSRTGSISLPLRPFIDEAARFVGGDLDGYSLMGIELGGEFDRCSAGRCVAATVAWRWRVSRLILDGKSGSIPMVFPVGRRFQ